MMTENAITGVKKRPFLCYLYSLEGSFRINLIVKSVMYEDGNARHWNLYVSRLHLSNQ